jgi:hypothetical protein
MGLLGAVAVLTAACARLPMKPAESGFHAAQPFRRPPAGADPALREALFRAHRVSVNLAGFQAGAVPMDAALLRSYLRASGAGDLAERALEADRRAAGWQKASDVTHDIATKFPLPGLAGGVAASLGVGSQVMAGIAEDERSAYTGLAAEFNGRLLAALGLPLAQGRVDPVAERPEPLGRGSLSVGLNGSFDDRVWERSIHRGQGPLEAMVFLSQVYRRQVYLIGGTEATGKQLTQHMRYYGGGDEAGRFETGETFRTAGEWTTWAGGLAGVAGFALFFAGQPPYQQANLNLGLLGFGVAALGPVMGDRGLRAMDRACTDFDAALPTRLRLKMKF